MPGKRTFSEESRRKMSESGKRRVTSPESEASRREKLRKAHTGRKFSDETRRKMSASAKARARRQWDDPEWRARFEKKMASDETRRRMSIAGTIRGKKRGVGDLIKWQRENVDKHRETMKRLHNTPEWRARQSLRTTKHAEAKAFLASIKKERDGIARLAASDKMPHWYYDVNPFRMGQEKKGGR